MRVTSSVYLLLATIAACSPSARPPNPGNDDAGAVEAMCGDGKIQGSETCDPPGSCPVTCPAVACGTNLIVGSPSTCDARCQSTPLTACGGIDGCCPTGCLADNDGDCVGVRLDAYYEDAYSLLDLGAVPGVPPLYGGLTVHPTDPGKLWIGGNANYEEGALYEIGIVRDADQHIIGFQGTAVRYADAAYNDGSILHGPGGVTFLTRWPVNEMGFMKPGSLITDHIQPLEPLGVAHSVASAAFTPPGIELGSLKLVSWAVGQWYSVAYAPNAAGTFDISNVTHVLTLPGGPEGIVYVPAGSPLFPAQSLLVSEYSANVVTTYEVDSQGDPIPGKRRLFVINLDGAEGATIDPTSGDFMFSTFGGGDRIIVVRGFAPIG